MKILFFGTPAFAIPSLEALLKSERFEVVGVVTQPDRPVGRKQIMTPPPIKVLAQRHTIPVLQPEKLTEEAQKEILNFNAELAVVVAYGNLIPKKLLESLPRGFVNVHPSLLPRHRGASPLTYTILEGDTETGVCLMQLDEQMDHGAVIACRTVPLTGTETTESLSSLLAPIGAEMLVGELVEYLDGNIQPQEQEHDKATFTKLIKTDFAKINWNNTASSIERLVRAMQGVTPAWAEVAPGEKLLIHKARVVSPASSEQPGTVLLAESRPAVACADGLLVIDELQISGKKIVRGESFLNGNKDLIGKRLV